MSQTNIIYNFPFIDVTPRNASINNKIQIGHPQNPGSAIILDGLNYGENKYDSAYIITCQKYLQDGHSNNFASDFEKRYNIEVVIINIKDTIDEKTVSMIENNKNIFLKIDLCDKNVYNILNLLNPKKYTQIVCTELPLPETKKEIEIFLKYNGTEITDSILKKMEIKSKTYNIKSEHYLFQFNSRWSIESADWHSKNDNELPPLQKVTFLKPELNKYIQTIEIGDSELPQKQLKFNMNNTANIAFINEFQHYPDKFSYYNDKNENTIMICRIDKTRMGWGQNLKAMTNIQMLPRVSNCVFVRKDILNNNQFTPIQNNPSFSLDKNYNTFNTQNKYNTEYPYLSYINIDGYKNILLNTIGKEIISEKFETKLVLKKKYKKKTNKIGFILPYNKTITKYLKTIEPLKNLQNIQKQKTLKNLYLNLNEKDKKIFQTISIKILSANIILYDNKETLIGNKIKKQDKDIIINGNKIKIIDLISDNNVYIILTNDFIDIKQNLNYQNIKKMKKIINDNIKIINKMIIDYPDYRILPEMLILYKDLF
jgi:molybdopterin converting factor small subunit